MTEQPDLPAFYFPVRVRFHETDLQGHLNFIWHPAYFSMAIAEYLKHIEFSYADMTAQGVDMVFVHADCSFHGPCYYEDLLHVHCRIDHVGNTSLRFSLTTVVQNGERRAASGEMTVVFLDHQTREKTSVPEPIRGAFQRQENQAGFQASSET